MWEMFDDIIECDKCGGIYEPPPVFTIPPPPRPPFLGDFSLTKCDEEEILLNTQKAWESDICEAIPIFDASLYSSRSFQTWAIVAVFTLLILLFVLISSLFVWKNKRKVQNFLPCKAHNRGLHINGPLPFEGDHALAYDDPDIRFGHHRPLMMQHHPYNVKTIHERAFHYPSGYPMTRSPPFLVSSSPGPDPYRSIDNVYEELGSGSGRNSDAELDLRPMQSDDEFAEDELSLPGDPTIQQMYDTQSNLMSLAYIPKQCQHHRNQLNNNSATPSFHSLQQLRNNNKSSKGHCNTLGNEARNIQLNNVAPVSSIYRDRLNTQRERFNSPKPYYASNSNNASLSKSMRARNVPSRSMERRHRVGIPVDPIEISYAYAEPVYHHNDHYDTCGASSNLGARLVQVPVSNSKEGPSYKDQLNRIQKHSNSSVPCHENSQLYSCGDSSFGSDSGYSQHTPASSVGQHDYDVTLPALSARIGNKESATNNISGSLGCRRHRQTPTSKHIDPAAPNQLYSNTEEEMKPNSNRSGTASNLNSTLRASGRPASTSFSQSNHNQAAFAPT